MNCIKNERIKNEIIKNERIKNERIKNELIKKRTDPNSMYTNVLYVLYLCGPIGTYFGHCGPIGNLVITADQ